MPAMPADPPSEGQVELHSPHYSPHVGHRLSGRMRRRLIAGALLLVAFLGALAAAGVLTGFLPNPVVAGDPKASGLNEPRDSGPLLVKVIKPRRENSFQITTLLPVATIEPFYQAGLRARVSGEV
ncbi:MAG TPA: hypothetical protein VLM40_03540, partial [Gemmata sp.]|nr:hypothetical protein [Gemmata sp.]